MATIHSTQVRGLAELHRVLEQFPGRIQHNVTRGAVRAGAKVLQETAARKARLATAGDSSAGDQGRLAENIVIGVRRDRDGDMVGGIRVQHRRYSVTGRTRSGKPRTITYDPGRLWHIFEFGTNERTQRKFKKKARRTGFIASRPYLRPTVTERTDAAVDAVRAYLERRLEREATKLAAAILFAQGVRP